MRNLINISLSILFFIFAIVQLNDPDPYLWVALYCVIAIVPILYIKQKLSRSLIAIFGMVLLLWTASYVPHFIEWLSAGMPSIVNSMAAETPYVELVREALGLLLSLCILLGYFFAEPGEVPNSSKK